MMRQAQSYKEISELLLSPKRTVFIFTADWCGDCQFIYPFLDELVAEFPTLTLIQVDRDRFMDVAATWEIFGIPSLVVTEKGQELGRLVNRARKTKEELTQFLQEFAKENQ